MVSEIMLKGVLAVVASSVAYGLLPVFSKIVLSSGGEIAQVHYFGEEVHSFKTARRCLVLFTHICPAVNDGDFVAMVGYEWHDYK